MRAINLKTEHMENPIGIDVREPYISWNCEGGIEQTAYEIKLYADGEEIWNSGIVSSDRMSVIYKNGLKSRQVYSFQVRLWDENGQVGDWSEKAFFETGILDKTEWKAKWINPELECDPEVHKPASYLRTGFSLESTIVESMKVKHSGRLYITAHGLYEAWINGKRVGAFVLAPGSYDYDKRIAYQTYDITELLVEGKNEVQVILGDGWYRSVSGVDGDRNLYGTDVALLFQLEIAGEIVCISDESWEASQNGPIRENDMQQGEVVDARLSVPTAYHSVKTEDHGMDTLIASNCVPVCEMERLEGNVIVTPNGDRVIDFGQNLAGYIEFILNAEEGDKIVLTHGETLDENGNFTQENFQDRKRHKEGGTSQKVIYTCKQGENHYKTKFSIWGFRYAKVETNLDISKAKFTAIAVYSKMEQLTEFTCGNEVVNKLVKNSIWSQKSNFCDVPTDCPTRERAAWTGDMGVFAHTGIYLMDCYPVIRKWLGECRLAQQEDGKIANIAPKNNRPSFFSGLLAGSVGWGDAAIIVPYVLYQRDQDVRILRENYEMMQKWYQFLENRAKKLPVNPVKRFKRNPYRRYTIETGIDYGEWCEPDVESTSTMRTPQNKVSTAFLAYSGQLMTEIATILGLEEDAKHYRQTAQMAKKAWRFIATENGKIVSDRQADYVRALAFSLLEDEEATQAAADLNELVKKCDYHLNTGFLSTPNLPRVLCDYDYIDTAYRLLLQDTKPSWLYEVKQGATTIWETWDGNASLNHYSYGAVCGWLIDSVCGIQVSGAEIRICPQPNKSLRFAKVNYQSPVGSITSGWKYEGEQVVYEIGIPANTKAVIQLPDGRLEKVGPGRYCF